MKSHQHRLRAAATALAAAIFAVGCQPASTPSGASAGPGIASLGPETSPVKPVLDKGWCGGHGVPESVCTRCDLSLVSTFKAAGDWCEQHDLPRSQCAQCAPEVAARWASLNPATAGAHAEDDGHGHAHSDEGDASGAPRAAPEAWCYEHGVRKAVCTRCDKSLIAEFKSRNDWCAEHGVPETQCTLCNPQVRAVWEGQRPEAPAPGAPDRAPIVTIERDGRRFASGENDPLCLIESSIIRFLDAGIVRQAGIETTPAQPRRLSAAIDVPAELEFDATRVTRVPSMVGGVAREVRASLGDVVQAGDLLAVLDSATLGEAKSAYIERLQNVRVAEAEHQRVKTASDGATRLLAEAAISATPAEIHQRLEGVIVGEAKATLLRSHAEFQLARAEAVRVERLFEQRVSSEKELQTARAELAAAEAEFLAIREEVAFASERDLLSAERGLRVARSELEAAQRRLHILGLSGEQIADVDSEPLEALSRYELRSPAAGRIVERSVTPGEAIDGAQTLFVLADTTTLWLVASVAERDLPALRVGQAALFTVDGLPGRAFQGNLNWISSEVDATSRLVPVRAELSNPDGLLRAHMFGRARIILHDSNEVLSVPIEAVQTDGCCQVAFVRESDDVFAPRKLRLGAQAGGYVEVLGGLASGEQVVTVGSFLLKTEILKGSIGAGCCEVDPGR